jgi:hypothetical protein
VAVVRISLPSAWLALIRCGHCPARLDGMLPLP